MADKHDIAKKISQMNNSRVRKWMAVDRFELDTGNAYSVNRSTDNRYPDCWAVSLLRPDGSKANSMIFDQQLQVKA